MVIRIRGAAGVRGCNRRDSADWGGLPTTFAATFGLNAQGQACGCAGSILDFDTGTDHKGGPVLAQAGRARHFVGNSANGPITDQTAAGQAVDNPALIFHMVIIMVIIIVITGWGGRRDGAPRCCAGCRGGCAGARRLGAGGCARCPAIIAVLGGNLCHLERGCCTHIFQLDTAANRKVTLVRVKVRVGVRHKEATSDRPLTNQARRRHCFDPSLPFQLTEGTGALPAKEQGKA